MAVLGNTIGEEVSPSDSFAREVGEGLDASSKYLSSKFFYDEQGDAIFQQIMAMPEYYLTRCEFEILSEQGPQIVDAIGHADFFQLIELGAGDGTKTIELLKELEGRNFQYIPVDISQNAIDLLCSKLESELPWLSVKSMCGEYFEVVRRLDANVPKVILFLGSNIGNLTDQRASIFMHSLSKSMNTGDSILLGVDRKKSVDVVLPAYDDAQGFTRDFNLNLLRRINRELGGDFDVESFEHRPEYDESTGVASSYLRSIKKQKVHISSLGRSFEFGAGERIHMETSRKYDFETLESILVGSGLQIGQIFTDNKQYFMDLLIHKKE